MQVNPIVERIIEGSICPAEIRLHNANRIMQWVRDTDRHHSADNCKSSKPKDCAHAPGEQTADMADVLTAEAPTVCVCGGHT